MAVLESLGSPVPVLQESPLAVLSFDQVVCQVPVLLLTVVLGILVLVLLVHLVLLVPFGLVPLPSLQLSSGNLHYLCYRLL